MVGLFALLIGYPFLMRLSLCGKLLLLSLEAGLRGGALALCGDGLFMA
ncbi:hypothetical protein Q8004_14375 [Edwardsiella piscicida]|nr:hypothetical protein [Edwardsiella piscicida]WCF11849.1 hypothetical protein N4G58_10550 [Edwardsiella piscicida]WLJ43004.1 hypothetical protein Q8004_14375 [Edwardsiella piscicida]